MNELGRRRPLRTAEVSQLTGIPVGTLRYYRYRNAGPPSYKLGGTVVYDVDALNRWWDDQREATLSTGPATA